MFFKDEEEKAKYLEKKAKDEKRYEKIEKRLFSDINQIPHEIDKNPSEDLKVVLFSNKDDLCKMYFETLSPNAEGENNFIKVFSFVFSDNNSLMDFKSGRMLLDDFKLYMNVAIDKRYVSGIDAVINFFENKIDVLNPINFLLMNSLEQENYSLIEFLFRKQGENGKKSKYGITENIFFADSKSLSQIIKYKPLLNFDHNLYKKVMSVTPYKKIAFSKDEFVNTFISKLKVFLLEAKETKDIFVVYKKSLKILDVFYDMDEKTVENLVYSFESKKEASLLYSFVSVFNKLIASQKIHSDYIENSSSSIYNQMFYLQKTFLNFATTDQKVELINNAFSNISIKYPEAHVEQVKNFQRKQILINSLEKEDVAKVETKTSKKKI